jgi:pimeloyl-ACP methyl ester carboxylesterase
MNSRKYKKSLKNHLKSEEQKVIDNKSLKKYYADVSHDELKKLQDFLDSHEIKRLNVEGKSVKYYSCGKGEQTILTFSGGHSGLETVYETILGFEQDFRMVVVDISTFTSLSEFMFGVTKVLEREGVGRVLIIGQSLSGAYSQIYFKECYGNVDAMVLTNTFAPSRKKRKKWALLLFRLFPFFLLKTIFKKKIAQWEPVAGIPAKAKERMRFKSAFMKQIVDQQFSKKFLMNALKVVFQFHGEGEYTLENFKDWNGKVLIISSKDDPCYEDADILRKHFPHSELFLFPEGYRHMAPMVFRDEYQNKIKDFFRKGSRAGLED